MSFRRIELKNAHEDLEVLAAMDGLFKLAASSELGQRIGQAALDIRARATLALALFVPHERARRHLSDLTTSPDVPERICNVASEALTNWGGNEQA